MLRYTMMPEHTAWAQNDSVGEWVRWEAAEEHAEKRYIEGLARGEENGRALIPAAVKEAVKQERREIIAEVEKLYEGWPGNVAWHMVIDRIRSRGAGPSCNYATQMGLEHVGVASAGSSDHYKGLVRTLNKCIDAIRALQGRADL